MVYFYRPYMKNDGIFKLHINDKSQLSKIISIGEALSSDTRIKILLQLYESPRTIVELSKCLGIKNSTIIFHLNCLEDSGLVLLKYLPTKKGKVKAYTLNFSNINISIDQSKDIVADSYIENMPIGMYIDAKFCTYFGLTTESEMYRIDVSDAFNEIRRNAQMLWFDGGYLIYRFSNNFLKKGNPVSISFSMEICSETQYYRNDWKSDIKFHVNGIYVGTFVSPGDFGGVRGKLTPQWWPTNKTQYGLLTTITINRFGSFIEGKKVSKVTIDDLMLDSQQYTDLKISSDKDSEHYGGISLFGRKFGNYPQDIVFNVEYE